MVRNDIQEEKEGWLRACFQKVSSCCVERALWITSSSSSASICSSELPDVLEFILHPSRLQCPNLHTILWEAASKHPVSLSQMASSALLIHKSNYFITEDNEVRQTQLTFSKSTLTLPSHILPRAQKGVPKGPDPWLPPGLTWFWPDCRSLDYPFSLRWRQGQHLPLSSDQRHRSTSETFQRWPRLALLWHSQLHTFGCSTSG